MRPPTENLGRSCRLLVQFLKLYRDINLIIWVDTVTRDVDCQPRIGLFPKLGVQIIECSTDIIFGIVETLHQIIYRRIYMPFLPANFGSLSSGPIVNPDVGSTQTIWSRTSLTPGTFCARTLRASRSRSSRIVPQRSTMPNLTVTSTRATGAHFCLSISTTMRFRMSRSLWAGQRRSYDG